MTDDDNAVCYVLLVWVSVMVFLMGKAWCH